jgi:hypothetical protein
VVAEGSAPAREPRPSDSRGSSGRWGDILGTFSNLSKTIEQNNADLTKALSGLKASDVGSAGPGSSNAAGAIAANDSANAAAGAMAGFTVLFELISKGRQFQFLMHAVNRMFAEIGSALGRLIAPLYPFILAIESMVPAFSNLTQLIMSALMPIIKALFNAFRFVVIGLDYVILGIAKAINGVLQFIAWIVSAWDQDAAKRIRAMELNTKGIEKSIADVQKINFDKAADAANRFTGALNAGLNAVTGYIAAQAMFQSYQVGGPGGAVQHFASGGGPFTSPTLALIGEGGEDEYVLTHSQLRNAIGGRGGRSGSSIEQSFRFDKIVVVADNPREFASAMTNELPRSGIPFGSIPQFAGN